MRIIQRDERTERLLAAVAERLNHRSSTPSEGGQLPILFDTELSSREAWERVHAALDASDPAWSELVTIGNRPQET